MKRLVVKAKQGDADAFVQLMEENRQSLYKAAICYVKNPEDAADIIQDTILTAFEKIGDLREPKYFRSWLIRMLINKCKDFLEKRSWEVAFGEIPERECRDGVLEHMIYEEMLQKAGEKYKDILVLYYVEGFTSREIAGMLEMKEPTVRTRLKRGREKLLQIYQKGESEKEHVERAETLIQERIGKSYAR